LRFRNNASLGVSGTTYAMMLLCRVGCVVGDGRSGERSGHSAYRTFLAADIESYSRLGRSDSDRVQLRHHLTDWCGAVFVRAGIDPGNWLLQDTGDGWLLSVDPNVSRSLLLDTVPSGLRDHLLAYNQDRPDEERLRVRLAMHAGDVLRDPQPFIGEATNHVCRLLDSEVLRVCLRATTQPLVVMVSAEIYQGVVRRAHGGLDPAAWHQVVVDCKEGPADAWVRVPGDVDAPARVRAAGATRAPYLGLASFQPTDAELYFGRERLVDDVVRRLVEQRFLAVFGASGSGKSSLLRAGLLPAIQAGRLPGSQDWPTILMTPGEHPFEELAIQLGALQGVATGALRADLEAQPANLDLAVRQALIGRPPLAHILLLVDQFEEVFTLCGDEGERIGFIDALLGAVRSPRGRTRVVLGVRADFYARCGHYPDLVAALRDAQLLVGPMTEGELRAVITQPALRAGLAIEPALVETALHDARDEPGALPLLSHALQETWKRLRGRMLTLADYLAVGGVQGGVAQTAEEVYGRLTSAQQEIARRIFLRLTAIGEGAVDTKRRASLEELRGDGDAEATGLVLERLAAARLVTVGEDSVEVTHEALIRSWPRLRDWLTKDRERLRLHRQLTQAAREWDALGREPDALYRGVQLAAAKEWTAKRDQELNALERAFLDTSAAWEARSFTLTRRSNRRLRALVMALSALTLAATILAGVAVTQRNSVRRQTQIANRRALELESARLAAKATDLARSKPALAFLTDLEALRIAPTSQARRTLLALLGQEPRRIGFLPANHAILAMARDPAATRLALALGEGRVSLWDLRSRRPLRVLENPGRQGGTAVAFTPDSTMLATDAANGAVALWDAPTGQLRRILEQRGPPHPTYKLAFSADGRVLTAVLGPRPPSIELRITRWDLWSGAPLQSRTPKLYGPYSGANAVAFTPKGHTVVVASKDETLDIVDLRGGPVVRSEPLPVVQLETVAVSPDGRIAAVGGSDLGSTQRSGIVLVDLASGSHLGPPWWVDGTVSALAFSRSGRTLVVGVGDGRVALLDTARPGVASSRMLAGHVAAVQALSLGPNDALASGGKDGTVILWDPAARTALQQTLAHPADASDSSPEVHTVAFDADGRLLLTATAARITLWDSAERKSIGDFPRPKSASGVVTGATLSPDSHRLAAVYTTEIGSNVVVWQTTSRAIVNVVAVEPTTTGAVAISPDGRRVAIAGREEVMLWDVDQQDITRSLTLPHSHWLLNAPGSTSLAFSPDGRRLALGGWGVAVWDMQDPLHPMYASKPVWVSSVAFSADGTTLAAGDADGGVDRFGLRTPLRPWRVLPRLTDQTRAVLAVAFSRQGVLASSAEDGTVLLHDATGQIVADTRQSEQLGSGLAFSPDGRSLAVGARDAAILLGVSPASWRTQACAIVGPLVHFGQGQWAKYRGLC
jgi:WD40 repeat protein/energy-coupling factor transporter ATP-binding protein EcfA2